MAEFVGLIVDDLGGDAGQRSHRRARLGGGDTGQREIMIAPVSVCHQVSTIGGAVPAPMTSRYQRQASG